MSVDDLERLRDEAVSEGPFDAEKPPAAACTSIQTDND